MSDEAAFLATLAESPADDTARLVYADWLDERGRPTEAAYLRAVVACAAAGGAVPESLIDLAEQLPRDWRLRTAARFALAMEWRESGRKDEAIQFLRHTTKLYHRGEEFLDARPTGALFRMMAEHADGIARHWNPELLRVRSEVGSLFGLPPSSGSFTIIAAVGPVSRVGAPTRYSSSGDSRNVLRDLTATALGITEQQATEKLATLFFSHPVTFYPLAEGHSLRRAHAELSRLAPLLPSEDSDRDWSIRLSLSPRVT